MKHIPSKLKNLDFALPTCEVLLAAFSLSFLADSKEEALQNFNELKEDEGEIWIFTDGSRTEEGVACGLAMTNPKMAAGYRLSNYDDNTVFEAELMGIDRGLVLSIALNNSRGTLSSVRIFTDSQAAVKNLSKKPKCKPGIGIVLNWIPGHNNIKGNELADTAANKATDPKSAQGHIRIPRSPSALKAIITTDKFIPKVPAPPVSSGKHHRSLAQHLSSEQTFEMLKEMP
ncbi:hypothetical protein BT69DRAFT_123245 [Atractiella rhizophila]|nr:hypothetical protein BT69DRAFT_123245 [Atractiella rhizophila]